MRFWCERSEAALFYIRSLEKGAFSCGTVYTVLFTDLWRGPRYKGSVIIIAIIACSLATLCGCTTVITGCTDIIITPVIGFNFSSKLMHWGAWCPSALRIIAASRHFKPVHISIHLRRDQRCSVWKCQTEAHWSIAAAKRMNWKWSLSARVELSHHYTTSPPWKGYFETCCQYPTINTHYINAYLGPS